MASRRKSMFHKLSTRDATRVVEDALMLRKTIIEVELSLIPSGQQCKLLQGVTDAIHEALPDVSGRTIDFRASTLAYFPWPTHGATGN